MTTFQNSLAEEMNFPEKHKGNYTTTLCVQKSTNIKNSYSDMLAKKWIIPDFVSKTQSQYLKASLYSYFNVQRPLTNYVPPSYHLLYFNSKYEESKLSKDGYDAHQQPPDNQFKRRMWVSGEMNFVKPLSFNKEAICVESIARFKKMKDNHFVTIQREILSNDEVAIEEKRQLIYTGDFHKELNSQRADQDPDFSHVLKPTDLLLFRYSALTFNSHKIHYDKIYAGTEGYPNILVQGPLTVTLLLEWLDTLFSDVKVKNFKYKNQSPIFSGETIKLALKKTKVDEYSVWIEGEGRKLYVTGIIVAERL